MMMDSGCMFFPFFMLYRDFCFFSAFFFFLFPLLVILDHHPPIMLFFRGTQFLPIRPQNPQEAAQPHGEEEGKKSGVADGEVPMPRMNTFEKRKPRKGIEKKEKTKEIEER